METCTVISRHNVYFPNNAPTGVHYKSASDGDSPDASMPMGSLASPLVDSGYHEGSVTYNHRESANSSGSLIDESRVVGSSKNPPPITPISGHLEKFKQYRMIRPVPLKATSPSRSLESTSSNSSSRRSLPNSPASMPDHVSDQQQRHQPPDVILTNQQKPAFAGNHFGALPTKCLSLQDITPKQRNYHDRGLTSPSHNGPKGWGKQPVQPRRIQPAHSLNHLNRNPAPLNSPLNHKQLLPDYKRRNISQSTSTVDDRRRTDNRSPKKPLRVSHSNPSYAKVVMDHNSNRVEGKSSVSSSSQVSSLPEEAETNEIASLRLKLLEKEAQLNTMRDIMDNNEVAILKVHEEKHRAWEKETSWLRKELQEQEETSRKIRHSLQSQLYKLEQERKTLREKLDSSHGQQPQHLPSKETDDLKWQLRNFKDQLSLKNKEMTSLRNKMGCQEHRMSEEAKTVVSLEAELEKILKEKVRTTEESQEISKRLLKEKEAELNEARVEADHLKKLKENLAQEVRVQEEELTLLRTRFTSKDKELSQERCEVAYLREVQEKLKQQLQKRAKFGGGLIPGIGNSPGNGNALKDKLAQKEKEIAHVREQLKRAQDEKDVEVGKLRQNLKERNSEVEKIQKKLSEAEKDCSMLRNKLTNGKGNTKMTPLQRQLESDFMDMQVKLTTREREVFQLKREHIMLQEKSEMDISNLKSKLRNHEHEQKGFQECILQREAEMAALTEKVNSQDSEIASLQRELENLASSRKDSDSENSQQRVEELEEEITRLEREREELCTKVMDLAEESAMYKGKLDKISQGVRSLSTSQSNLINMGKGTPTGTGTNPRPSKLEDALQSEIKSLKEEMAACRQRLQSQDSKIARERRVWQEEKEKVIKYQKQLQLNYVQMCRRNRSLESDLQQLTMELEHKEITHC